VEVTAWKANADMVEVTEAALKTETAIKEPARSLHGLLSGIQFGILGLGIHGLYSTHQPSGLF
jgi:hypothetical protein